MNDNKLSLYDYVDLAETVKESLSGNPFAITKLLSLLVQKGLTSLQKLPYLKLERYLKGVQKAEDDYEKANTLSDKLFSNPKQANDNAMRIIEYVSSADTKKKIDYYVNATKALLYGKINNATLFRIFDAISKTLPEDLEYMAKNIEDEDHLIGNLSVLALSQDGLTLIAGIHQGENVEQQEYVFSNLAYLVDRYAVSLDNDERQRWYENNSSSAHELNAGIPGPIPLEEIEQILK